MNHKSQKGGFTLIEVLIVVFIIGLLASVVLVGVGSFRARGRDARRVADLHLVQTALELYYQAEGQYPDAGKWGDLKTALERANIGVDRLPNDPSGGRDYFYGADSRRQRYVLGAELDDSNNPLLKNDEDGLTYGVDCGGQSDNVYCTKF